MLHDDKIQDCILSGREKMVLLPQGLSFDGARFDQVRDDLVITGSTGGRVFIRHFFQQEFYPDLMCDDGELMSGEMATAFITLSACAMSALLEIDNLSDDHMDSAF